MRSKMQRVQNNLTITINNIYLILLKVWIYSHRGEIFYENWDDWGRKIELTHKFAVVFATEMDFELVGSAPHSPTTVASMGNDAQGCSQMGPV